MIDRFLCVVLVTLTFLSPTVMGAPWTVSVNENDGLPIVTKGGAKAISATYAFWGANWKWADQHSVLKVIAPFEYAVVGKNQTLNFGLAGRIWKPTNNQLIWEFDLNAHDTVPDAIGGGMVFMFDLAAFGQELGTPELLPNNQGWVWGRPGKDRIEMRFDPPLASVYFERGRKEEIRAFFYKGRIPAGQRRHTAVMNLSGDMQIGPTVGERFGVADVATWQTDIIDSETSPVDLSFMNDQEKPAGRRGFIKVIKDKLVFEDGTVARFWGTNLTASALFGTSKANVKRQARRLSELGFNLVRFHHHDSPWVNPNIFGDQKGSDTKSLSSDMLDKLDWWIKCLKDEGIYVWLDLHVQRGLKAGDQIEGFDEIRKGQIAADLKGYNYVNSSIKNAMQRFNEAYVNHPNHYTGLRYKNEPSIVAMLITNENDVTHHFGNFLLPDKNVPLHSAWYMSKANTFAAAWDLPKDKTWRAWEHGPSKLFLNDLEQRFNAEMIVHLRAQGVRVPIATTNSWGNPLSSLPALSAGHIIDAHAYGGIGELETNPFYAANLMHWIAAAQIVDRPLSVTEWNVSPFPAPDRHAIPLFVAGSASLQGWDALMQYAYSQEPIANRGTPSNWHSYNDPALIATLPAAALLYRQGHVREAITTYNFSPGKGLLFNQAISAASSVALRTAAEKGKLVISMPQTKELPWLEKSVASPGSKIITDPQQAQISASAVEVVSDTGELRRNWDEGTYIINTPRTQAAMGWIGGKSIDLTGVKIAIATRNATVAVQSLDGNSIGQSKNVLISLSARSVPKPGDPASFYSEPVEGKLFIAAPQGLKLHVWDYEAGKMRVVPAPYKDGRYFVVLDRALRSYWLFLHARPGASPVVPNKSP